MKIGLAKLIQRALGAVSVVMLVVQSSCSTLFPYTTNVHVTDRSSADSIRVHDMQGARFMLDSGSFRASGRLPYYTVERFKRGFLPNYTTIEQDVVNPLLLLDGLCMAVGILLMPDHSAENRSEDSMDGKSVVRTTFFVGGLWGLVFGHKAAFRRPLRLLPMTPVPVRSVEQRFLAVDRVSLALGSDQVETRYFGNMKKYHRFLRHSDLIGDPDKVVNEQKSFKAVDIAQEISMDLNVILKESGHQASVADPLDVLDRTVVISVEVTGLSCSYFKGHTYDYGLPFAIIGDKQNQRIRYKRAARTFRMETRWTMVEPGSGKILLRRTYITDSDITVIGFGSGMRRAGYLNALAKAMVQLLNDEGFAAVMMDDRIH